MANFIVHSLVELSAVIHNSAFDETEDKRKLIKELKESLETDIVIDDVIKL